MSLILCEGGCGKFISEDAPACPHCGHPALERVKEELRRVLFQVAGLKVENERLFKETEEKDKRIKELEEKNNKYVKELSYLCDD